MDDYPYGPNTGAKYFHLAGCQWLLHIGDDGRERRFQIEVVDVPRNWKVYSSKSKNARRFEVVSSYNDLASAPIGGGENSHLFRTQKGTVAVFVHGDFAIPRAKIYSSIEQIIRLERGWFDDYSQPHYTIVVAPRSDVTAGYAPENAFVCFIDRETKLDDLNLLVAHEFFHNWLPNKIEIVQDKKYASFRLEWFTEGFTDFLAQKILSEANLILPEKFVEMVNRNIYNIADNPHRARSYDELVALGKAGKFDGTAKKLAYYRGALIALNWDAKIRRTNPNRNLSTFIRELFKLAQSGGGRVSEQAFYDLASSYGIDANAEMERYITRGEAILPDKDALGSRYPLREVEIPAFDVGFSLDETQRSRKISRVIETGAAYKAGLRDGMEFVGTENAYRFSNSWKRDMPLVVRVKINGEERRIEYFPHGAPLKLSLFDEAVRN
jgi:predicted metalloprotease with PDZ domain